MNYIQNATKGKYEWWMYLVGFIIVCIAWQFLGAIPLGIVVFMKAMKSGTIPNEISGMVDLIGNNPFLILMILTFAAGLFALFFWVKKVHKLSITQFTTARAKIDYKRVVLGFAVVLIINLLFFGIGYSIDSSELQYNFQLEPFLYLLAIVILLLPLQTSFEEYLFRGYLMQGMGILSKNRAVPFIITSVLFGVMHMFNPEVAELGPLIMIYYIGTGFFLGALTLLDDGMELSLGFHAGNNMLAALLVTSDWSALQTDAIFKDISQPTLGLDVFLPVIIYPLLLLFFGKIYKWTNWKEKLFGTV